MRRGRTIHVVYVYQKPELAWQFVKAREVTEGRNIPVEEFIRQLFAAKETVLSLKRMFNLMITIDLIIKILMVQTAWLRLMLTLTKLTN